MQRQPRDHIALGTPSTDRIRIPKSTATQESVTFHDKQTGDFLISRAINQQRRRTLQLCTWDGSSDKVKLLMSSSIDR